MPKLSLEEVQAAQERAKPQPVPQSKKKHTVPTRHHLPEGPLVQLMEVTTCDYYLAVNKCPNLTYYALNGRPACVLHALREMNTMLAERSES